jgi:hypothetical protein
MRNLTRRAAVVAAATAFGLMTFVGPALAEDTDPGKCNSGRGNGSETVPESDCDPGNSGSRNSGGD